MVDSEIPMILINCSLWNFEFNDKDFNVIAKRLGRLFFELINPLFFMRNNEASSSFIRTHVICAKVTESKKLFLQPTKQFEVALPLLSD